MKVLSVLLIVGAYIMGAYDGDSTVAIVMTMLLAPVIFERKSRRKKQSSAEVLRQHNGVVLVTKDCEKREFFADMEKTHKSFDGDGAGHLFLGGIEV